LVIFTARTGFNSTRSWKSSEIMLDVELVWICSARWFWVLLVESVWAVFQNVPSAHAWRFLSLKSGKP